MNPWGVIFDMDGVLVDSSEVHLRAWRELGEEVGRPFTPELFQQTFGMHNQQIMPMWLGEATEQTRIEELATRKEILYREYAARGLEPLEGVRALLGDLQESGARLAVGSSGPLANVRLILETLQIAEFFPILSTGDDVHQGKPDPQVFWLAAQRMDLPPDRCLVIEDAPQGIEAARRAGMKVLAVTSSRPAHELLADTVVSSLAHVTAASAYSLVAGTSSSSNISGN